MNCPCCDRPEPLNPTIIGVQEDLYGAPALILWNCVCGTTRAIEWTEASYSQRIEAGVAQMSRDAHSEMMVEK